MTNEDDAMTSSARILVVDDNAEIAQRAREELRLRNFPSDYAPDVPAARALIAQHPYDLYLLDIVMPGTSGKVLCREIAETSDAAIIMVSSLSDDAERISLLELGADDYIVKPYNPNELLARVRAVLRRKGASILRQTRHTHFGPWTMIDDERHLKHEDGRMVALTSSEAALMRHFLANPGTLHSRSDLLAIARMRQHSGIDDRSVDTLVKRLRKKIELDPSKPSFIQTVWGKGYTFHLS